MHRSVKYITLSDPTYKNYQYCTVVTFHPHTLPRAKNMRRPATKYPNYQQKIALYNFSVYIELTGSDQSIFCVIMKGREMTVKFQTEMSFSFMRLRSLCISLLMRCSWTHYCKNIVTRIAPFRQILFSISKTLSLVITCKIRNIQKQISRLMTGVRTQYTFLSFYL